MSACLGNLNKTYAWGHLKLSESLVVGTYLGWQNNLTGNYFISLDDTGWVPTGSVVVHNVFQPMVSQKLSPRVLCAPLL